MISYNLLRGDRVRLTALGPADLAVVARWQQDAGFLRLFDARPAFPQGEAALTEWLNASQKATDAFLFGARLVEGDDLLGFIELDEILWAHGACGMSYCIGDPAQRGRGYGYEATQLALAFAFGEINLHRVTLTAFEYNQPSIALAEKLGFRREGVFREFLQRDGRRYDMLLFGLLRHEWQERNEDK
jgi:RimJ/RimL family protein N-acetyltransferase